jgi:hypothetical protein
VVKILLLMDVAKLFWREGTLERSALDSPLLDALRSPLLGSSPGKAQAKPLVGAAAIGSGIPDTLRGFGLITGALLGGWMARGPPFCPLGDRGDAPLVRGSPVIPRCCCKFDTSDTLEAFWLSYGDDGLMARWFIPTFMRLSTLLRRESKCELAASTLSLWSTKPWFNDGRVFDCSCVRFESRRG